MKNFLQIFLKNLKNELNNNKEKKIINYNNNKKNNKNTFEINENFYNLLNFSLLNNNNNSINSFINEFISILKNEINTNENIIIRLKRGDKNENKKIIKITKKIYIDSSIIINDKKYFLKSIVIHIGNKSGSGHFINVTKINDKWYYFNDDEYKLCNVKNINDFNFRNNKNNNVKNNAYYILYSLNP